MRNMFCAIAALCLFTGSANAEVASKCGPRADLVKVLTDKYHEIPVAIGMVDDKLIMETFASNTGTWTMFFTNAEGTSCMVSAGKDWQFDTTAFDDAKKGEAM
jgi:putative Ca2+/H+ antiporter (TMEM165/GDT1 family)